MLAMQYVDIMDLLPEIKVPTLLVGGRYDECMPGHLEEMHRRIAGWRLVIVEDASHLCFAEQPARFTEIVSSFIT
jgi:proline iminopeptidase